PVFRLDADELVLTVPAAGFGADWLARPLPELRLPADRGAYALRVDAPPAWRWSTSDAAFLATVVRDLEGPTNALEVFADARLFVELMGQVVLLLPKYGAGRARIRRADVWEMFADCGHRALPIVAIVNLLMGGILAFVGAV